MRTEISLCSRFEKQALSIQEVAEIIREFELNQTSGSNQITASDSGYTYHICFLWEIVIFTKACK